MQSSQDNNEAPLVSVIIPMHNAASVIKECIMGVLDSDYPHFEVIVVDDGSTDKSGEIVTVFKDVIYVKKKNGGSAAAKNYGTKFAQGEYLYFLDSDVVIFKKTISMFVNTALIYNVDLVVGRYSTYPMNNAVVHHYKAIVDYVLYIPRKYRKEVKIDHQIGGGGDFYSVSSFRILGGFNESYRGASVEREELYLRFYEKGYHSAANPMIKTRHYFPDFGALIKNYFYRIYETVKLIDGREIPFSYISFEKTVVAPLCSVLAFSSSMLYAGGLVPGWEPIIMYCFFFIFSRELIEESLRCKGFTMTLRILIIHFFVSMIILLSGTFSVLMVKSKKVLRLCSRAG